METYLDYIALYPISVIVRENSVRSSGVETKRSLKPALHIMENLYNNLTELIFSTLEG
jgi:hypothetical protein